MPLIVIQGSDQLKRQEEIKSVYKRYKTDDFNFTEFTESLEIGPFTAALQQSPMFVDWYLVVTHVNKRQFIRLKEYFKPSPFTVLLLILEDFVLSSELQAGLTIDELLDCKPIAWKDTVRWLQTQAKSLGFSLELDDRKKLALMCQTSKEMQDILTQMSYLSEFDRMEFFNELFATRQKFVWDIFIDLARGKKKDFFTKYAEQLSQNVELSKSQFNMKLIGGLIYCLGTWRDSPTWIYERLDFLEESEEKIVPYMYSTLIELLAKARFEDSNIPILKDFVIMLDRLAKIQ